MITPKESATAITRVTIGRRSDGVRASLRDDQSDTDAPRTQVVARHRTRRMHCEPQPTVAERPRVRGPIGVRLSVDVHNQRRLGEHQGTTPAETLERFRAIIDSTIT